MAKSFLDIISLTRKIGEENSKMQRTPTARSSTTKTAQTTQKKKSLADITALTRSVGGGVQPTTTTVQNVARASTSLSEQADAEMQANAKVFNPYAPNYGQYTAEDYGYRTGQQTVEPTVTAQTPRQRAESAVSIKEQTERNSRELLLKGAWTKSQNAVISAQEEYDKKRDSKSESALRAARARANTAEKAYNDFITDYKSSVVGYSDEDYKKFKVARTLQEIAAQRQQDYNNALIQWTGRGKKDDRYKAYMESAKRKLDEANAAVQRAEAKRTGSFYTDDEGNVYATKDALDRAIKAKERASSRDLAEFAAQRALQGNAADMRALDEQTREEYDRLQQRTEREQAEIASLRNARAEAQKRQKQMDDIGEALLLEREVRQNPAAFEANVAAGQQQSSTVSRSLANDGESPYRTLTTYEQQTFEALLGSGQADKAQAYLAAKEDELARRAGYLREEYEREENPLAPVANLVTAAGTGIVSGAEGLVNAFNAVTGNEDTVDWAKEADYFRQYRSQDIAEGRTGSQLEQVAGDIIYNIGRMTPAVAASLAGAPAWVPSVIVGVSAGGNAYSEAIENGMDASQAATYAILNGTSEALMERFLGGIQQLTGGRSATQSLVKSWMSDFAKRSAFTSLVADAVASFGGEFVEETLQSLIEPALKNVTWGTSQAADVKEALYEGLLGGLTGVLMTGVGSIGTYVDAIRDGNVSPRAVQETLELHQDAADVLTRATPYLQKPLGESTYSEVAEAIAKSQNTSVEEGWRTLNRVAEAASTVIGKGEISTPQYNVQENMNDARRYNELKDATITPARYTGNTEQFTEADVQRLERSTKRDARRYVQELYAKFGLNRRFNNQNIDLDFQFSNRGLNESMHQQSSRNSDYATFGKMLSVFDEVVQNAVPLETHTDKYAGTKRAVTDLEKTYVLLSAFEDNGIVPVQLEVKEYRSQDNQLYLAVTLNKIEAGVVATALPSDNAGVLSVAVPSSTYSIPDILKNVNPLDGDFLKYVPDGFLSDAQQEGKRQAQERDRRKIAALRGEPADLTALYRTVANTTDADSPIRRNVEAMYRAALQGEMVDRMAARQYDTRSRRELNRARAAQPTLAEQLRAVNNNTLLGDNTAPAGTQTTGRDVAAGTSYDYAAMADDISRRTNYPVTAQDISAVVPTALDLGSTSAETAQAADAVARSIIERAGGVPDSESVARLAGAIGDAVYETVNARTIYEATHDASGKVIPPNQRQTNILYGNETKAWRQQQEKARRYRGGKTVYDAFFSDVGELERLSRLGDQNAVTLNDQVQQVRDATKRANTILQDNLVDRYGNVLGPSFDALARETNLASKEFQRYLLERRNLETLERGKNVTASTAEESQRYVDRINKLQPHYAEYAQRIYDWLDAAGRAYLVDTGLMSAEQYDAMRAQEPSYIPVIRQYGQEMQLVDPLEIGTPVIGTGTGVRRMEGGKTDVLDLRDSMSRYFARLVRNAAQNDLLVKIYDMAQNTPGAKGYVALAADLPGRNDVTSLDDVVVRPDTAQGQKEIGSREYVLEARIDGQGRGMYVTRPMYEAVERLFSPREVGPIEGVARKITGIQRQIFTQKNPFFVARNQMRDLQTYLATTDGNQVRNLITYFTSLVPKAGTENARLWKQYKDMGLKQESSFLGGKGDYEAYLKTQLGIRESKGWGKAGALLRDLARALEAAGEWSENAPRFAEYKNALRKYGDTPEGRVKAAQAAAEITVNFSRGGTLSRRINSFVPFFNAGMQGLDKIVRNFRNKPGRSAIRYLGKTTLASILINLIAGNYDNRNYDELNDRAKAGYWNIPIGLLTGDVDEDGKSKTFLKLRKGEAESLFGALGEHIARMLVGNEEWDAQKLVDTLVEGATNMAPNNPLSSNMFAPFIEISQNRDWAGRAIVPANLQDMPPELQYDATTSWTSKQLGQLLGVSPMMLDHLLTGYGSDYGKFIKSITSTAEGGDLTSSLRNTFIADPRYSSGVVSNFYDANRRIQDDVKRIEARDDYVEGTKTEAHAAEAEMKKIAKEMSDLTKEEKRIQGDTTLTTGEKRQRINALREERNALARGAEERVAAAVEEWKATYVPEFDGRSEKAIEELNELRGTGGMSDAQLAEVYDVLKDAKADKATGRSAAQVKAEYIDSLNLSDPGPLYEKFVLKDDEENAEKLMLAKNNGLTATEYYDIISTKPRTDEKGETISNSKYIDQLDKILASDASNKYELFKSIVAKDDEKWRARFRITEDLGFTDDNFLRAYNKAKAVVGDKDKKGNTIQNSHDKKLMAQLNNDSSLTPNERRALYIMFATGKSGYNKTLETLIGATSFDPRVKNTLYAATMKKK